VVCPPKSDIDLKKLAELKTQIAKLVEGKKFAFCGYGAEAYGVKETLYEDHVCVLYRQGIQTIEQFKEKFKYVLNDPNHDIVRNADVIYSTVNLWEGLEAGYNNGSVDWESFVVPKINNQEDLDNELDRLEAVTALAKETLPSGTVTEASYTNIANYIKTCRENPGLALESKFHLVQTIKGIYIGLYCYASYTYSFADLKVRPYIKDWDVVQKAEKEGFIVALSIGDGYKQYVAQYNTDKAYFLGEQYLEMVFLNQTLKAMNDMFRGLGIAWRNSVNRQARLKMQRRRVDLERLKGQEKKNEMPDMGVLRVSTRDILANEGVIISEAQGRQVRKYGGSKFANVKISQNGDKDGTYLWTIDEGGLNVAYEGTPFPTPRGNIVHSNISTKAYIAGELWFTSSSEITINAGSGRFGYGSGATISQYNSAVKYFESLGYKVTVIPFNKRKL
jgi:hypothetical protein